MLLLKRIDMLLSWEAANSGKTTLLKMTFKELQTQYVVLYCGTDDITGRSQENILKELVTDTYGADSYSLF